MTLKKKVRTAHESMDLKNFDLYRRDSPITKSDRSSYKTE